MVKKRTNISIDENILKNMKETGVNISEFCEDKMVEFLDFINNTNHQELEQLELEKAKIDSKLHTFYKIKTGEYDYLLIDKESELKRLWDDYLEYHDMYLCKEKPRIELEPLAKLSGLLPTEIITLGDFVDNYVISGGNIEIYNGMLKDMDYAFMIYNKNNPNNPLVKKDKIDLRA